MCCRAVYTELFSELLVRLSIFLHSQRAVFQEIHQTFTTPGPIHRPRTHRADDVSAGANAAALLSAVQSALEDRSRVLPSELQEQLVDLTRRVTTHTTDCFAALQFRQLFEVHDFEATLQHTADRNHAAAVQATSMGMSAPQAKNGDVSGLLASLRQQVSSARSGPGVDRPILRTEAVDQAIAYFSEDLIELYLEFSAAPNTNAASGPQPQGQHRYALMSVKDMALLCRVR